MSNATDLRERHIEGGALTLLATVGAALRALDDSEPAAQPAPAALAEAAASRNGAGAL